MRARIGARGRLTLLCTALVFSGGLALIALTAVLVWRTPRYVTFVDRGPADSDRTSPAPDPPPEAADDLRAEALQQLLAQAALALVVVTVLAAVLCWLLAGRVLRPIRTITVSAQRLSVENMAERIPVHSPADELAALARTVNGMLDRIQSGFAERDRLLASQRMFVANAAHELRTPLTTMRTAIDVTLDGDSTADELRAMARDVGVAITRSRNTLDGLLTLARSQAGAVERADVDLAEVVAEVLDAARAQAAARSVTLRSALRPAPLRGEPILVERLVVNLVENAVRYNVTGGTVEVTTETTGETAALRVVNTGPVVPPAEAQALVEPFIRAGGSRRRGDGGAGLGLSIVRAIVEAHDGAVVVTARPGGGLDVTVRLPAAGGS